MLRRNTLIASLLVCAAACSGNCSKLSGSQEPSEPDFMHSVKGAPTTWDYKDIPYMLLVDDDAAPIWGADFSAAVLLWNHTIERTTIVDGGSFDIDSWNPSRVGVLVVLAADPDEDPTTHLVFDQNTGQVYGALITMPPAVADALKFRAAVHEMGHGLGLDHDPALPRSVMFPKATGDGTNQWYITEHDRLALQGKYNPAALLVVPSSTVAGGIH